MISNAAAQFAIALAVVAAVAVLATRWRSLPQVSLLTVIGLAAALAWQPQPHLLTSDLVFYVFLPGLLFAAAFEVDWEHLRPNLWLIAILATAGVLLTAAVVAVGEHGLLGVAWPLAILMGTVLAPTDPVAVVAVFHRLRAPARLTNLVEAESLFNDGTGVILFSVAATGALQGQYLDSAAGVLVLPLLHTGALVLGAVAGVGLGRIARVCWRQSESPPELAAALSLLAAYGSYLGAAHFRASGILAVVMAGLFFGREFRRDLGVAERGDTAPRNLGSFWSQSAGILNAVLFLLIGLSAPWPQMRLLFGPILIGFVISLFGRASAVYLLVNAVRPLARDIRLRWQHILNWGGMKGAIAVALLLLLGQPGSPVPAGSAIVPTLYGIVLLSIVVQGFTIGPMARMLPKAGGTR